MPRLEIFGPVSAGDIVNALRTASYAGKLTFVRNSKNANDITGKAVSFIRFYATRDAFTSDEMRDLVDRLRPIVGLEVSPPLSAWFEPVVQKPPAEPKPYQPGIDGPSNESLASRGMGEG